MVVFFVIVGYIVIGITEIIPLLRNKEKKELVVYVSLFSIAFVFSFLLSIGVEIMDVSVPILRFVNSLK